MSSTDELQARELGLALDALKGRLGDYPRARDGSKGWTDGYPTRTTGHGEHTSNPTGEIGRPVEHAVIAALEPGRTDRATGLHHELDETFSTALTAVHQAIDVIEYARRTGAIPGAEINQCEHPDGCINVVTGLEGNRLRRFRGKGPRLCPAHYHQHRKAALAAGLEDDYAHTSESTNE